MNIKKLFFFCLFIAIVSNGQVPKKILMEYATNASCPPCATFNPGNYDFLKSNYNNTVAVWYHAWWPGPNDPMFVANDSENRARINYYGINGVPDYVLNGKEKGWSTNDLTADLKADHAKFTNLESPLKINVTSTIVADSLKITISLKALQDINLPDLVLHTAITEQMVKYQSPPGSNGEEQFPHVFRKFCAGSNGEPLQSLTAGDSLRFTYTEFIDESWNKDVLTTVAWVQSFSTKEVVQAASDLFFYEVTTSVPGINILSKNESMVSTYSIENILEEDLQVRIKTQLIENNQGWSYSLHADGSPFDSLDIMLLPGETFTFDLNLETNSSSGNIDLDILAESLKENSNFKSRVNFYAAVVSGDVLIVDDDGEETFEQNYLRYFNNKGMDFSKLSLNTLLKIYDNYGLENFKYVFWNVGTQSPTLDTKESSLLMDYLADGGNLFIASQNLGYDIHEVTKLTSPRFLYSVYLDALYVENTDTSSAVESIPDNPLFNGLAFTLNNIYPNIHDVVESKRGNSIPVLEYSESQNPAMLIHTKGESKISYLTFGLEQIESEQIQDSILSSVMNWFDSPTGLSDDNANYIPANYLLEQNYPNPFNPATSISYQIIKPGNVNLSVYDLLGQKISTIINTRQAPGRYSVEFNAERLNSGIYFYSIKTNDFIDTKKMLLIK